MKRKIITAALAAAMLLGSAGAAAASYDGPTFIGKGDVQNTFDWNNKALQDGHDDVRFRIATVSGTQVTWECTNTNNENTQGRSRTTTTTTSGLVSSTARDDRGKQITGFNVSGYSGTVVTGDAVTDGPAVNSCPGGPWTLTTPAGDPQPIADGGSTIEVSKDKGVNWTPLVPKA
jgi:hypothetical protein